MGLKPVDENRSGSNPEGATVDLCKLFGPEWAILVDDKGRIEIVPNPYKDKDA